MSLQYNTSFKKIQLTLLLLSISLILTAQNQLPVNNASYELYSESSFINWNNQTNNGGEATFSVITNDLFSDQSTAALKVDVVQLGDKAWNVGTNSLYPFEVAGNTSYTVVYLVTNP